MIVLTVFWTLVACFITCMIAAVAHDSGLKEGEEIGFAKGKLDGIKEGIALVKDGKP